MRFAVSNIQCPLFSVDRQVSSVQCPLSYVQCPVSSVQSLMSSAQCPASSFQVSRCPRVQVCSIQCPVSNFQCPDSIVQCPSVLVSWCPVSSVQCPFCKCPSVQVSQCLSVECPVSNVSVQCAVSSVQCPPLFSAIIPNLAYYPYYDSVHTTYHGWSQRRKNSIFKKTRALSPEGVGFYC